MNTKMFSRIQKSKFMGLKRVFKSILVSLIILFLLNPPLSLEAQERVKSLSVRQFEIEEAIRNGLKYYLDTKDYVLRVKLFGEERSIGSSIANEALPGFGQLNDSVGSGAKYWEITRMRVDLVMHKEVSPSVNTYIGEIVPILSGLDYERGDELIFVPILPSDPFPEQVGDPSSAGLPDPMAKALPEDDPKDIEVALQSGEPSEEQDGESLEEEPFWLRMSDIEKILAGMLLFLILLFFWVLLKLRKFKAISTGQEGFPALMPPQSETPQLPSPDNQGFASIADTNAKLLKSHENHEASPSRASTGRCSCTGTSSAARWSAWRTLLRCVYARSLVLTPAPIAAPMVSCRAARSAGSACPAEQFLRSLSFSHSCRRL